MKLISCTFKNCRTVGKGGAIFIDNKKQPIRVLTAVVVNCTFKGNKAYDDGGAIAADTNGVIRIESCYFQNNRAAKGGGIMLKLHEKIKSGVQTKLTNSIFIDNTAILGGGVYINRNRTFHYGKKCQSYCSIISQGIFTNNSASISGQSVYDTDDIRMTDTSISCYEQFVASHLHLNDADIELINTTISLFRENRRRISTESSGVELKSNEIKISKGFLLICPVNFQIKQVENSSELILVRSPFLSSEAPLQKKTITTFLKIGCIACHSPTTYNLQRGSYQVENLQSSNEDVVPFIHNASCMPCPTGKTTR